MIQRQGRGHDGKKNSEPNAPHPGKLPNKGTIALVLAGMAGALGVFVALMAGDFQLPDMLWALPALAVSAAMVFIGARKLKKQK